VGKDGEKGRAIKNQSEGRGGGGNKKLKVKKVNKKE
jgi:hypothetical protein